MIPRQQKFGRQLLSRISEAWLKDAIRQARREQMPCSSCRMMTSCAPSQQKGFFTYANPVVDYHPQKEDPHRIRITAGGNLIHYEGNASVRTADIDTAKIHWNSVISTPHAKYMCLDIKKFYLTAALEYFEYMKIPLDLFPEWTKMQYNLNELALDGWVHIEMRRAVWGLPQAGILANKRLRRKLAPFGYSESVNTPGLWTHTSRPISFTLVVDDFRVKYVAQDDVEHLMTSITSTYSVTVDWMGNLYCGISLDWDYVNRTRCLAISKRNCMNTSTLCPKKCNHARTHLSQSDLARKPRRRSHPIPRPNSMQKGSNRYKKSWAAFSIMQEPSI